MPSVLLRGASTARRTPIWQPLLAAVGEEGASDFMWMFEVALSDGRTLQAYKHIDTRCYAHLDGRGEAFVYESPDRYRTFPLVDLFELVLPRDRFHAS